MPGWRVGFWAVRMSNAKLPSDGGPVAPSLGDKASVRMSGCVESREEVGKPEIQKEGTDST